MRAFGWVALLPLVLWGADLRLLVDHALKNDPLIASQMQVDAADRRVQSAKAGYLPTLDLALAHHEADDVLIFEPQSTAALRLGWVIFDGFATTHQTRAARSYAQAALLSHADRQMLTASEVIRLYFMLQSADEAIAAQEAHLARLELQRQRLEGFAGAEIASRSQYLAIDSAYESARYALWQLKNNRLHIALSLEAMSGLSLKEEGLPPAALLTPPKDLQARQSPQLAAQSSRVAAAQAEAKAIGAANWPKVSFENTYSQNRYEEANVPGLGTMPTSQNRATLSVSMRLFDFQATSRAAQSATLEAQAAAQQLAHAQTQQLHTQRMSLFGLQSAQVQLDAASRSLSSAQESFDEREKRFRAGLIDEVSYLEALATLSEAAARLAAARGDWQIAKAQVYYAHGHNPKEFIQ